MLRLTVITGASTGIGEALAHVAAARGRRLVLTARSGDRLKAVADTIAASGGPRPETIALDLAEPGAPRKLCDAIKARGLAPSELVNNAGYGLVGPVTSLDREQQLGIIDLNVRALTELTLLLLPQIAEARGGILNVASVAAFLPGPGMAIYYASKAFVLSFSEALHYEMKGRIRVTALCPGPTPTEFQARANPGGSKTFRLMPKTSARQVAEVGWRGFERGRRVVIPGLVNRVAALGASRAPRGIVLPVGARLMSRRHSKAP